MAMSNIRNYGRVHLLIEMLIRFYRVLKEEDKERFKEMLAAYTKQTSGQYIYKLERAEIPRELEKLGEIYHKLHEALRGGYKEIEIFRIFERVYQEHFTVVKNKGKLRVRGQFKTMMYACSMGISINFGRIHRYLMVNPDLSGLLGLMKAGSCLFLKNLVQIGQKVRNIFRFVIFKVKTHCLSNFEIKYYQVA